MTPAPVDFFEAQRRARRRTAGVLAAGALALLLVAAAYGGAAVLVVRVADLGRPVDVEALVALATGVPLLWAAVSGWRAFRAFSDGERGALRLGARPAQTGRPDERVLRNVVEEVAVAAALPAPALFVWDEQPGINALALGHDPRDGALVFTDQAVQTLSRDALQAMAAHEMAHLAAGDTRLNGLLVAVVAGLEAPLRAVWKGSKAVLEDDTDSRAASPRFLPGTETADNPSLTAALLVVIGAGTITLVGAPWLFTALAIGIPAYLLLGLLGLLLARLLAVSVARQREHHADALALQLTRHPDGLTAAVRALADAPLRGLVLSRHREAIRHFFFGRPDIPSPVWGDALSAHPDPAARLGHIGRLPTEPAVPTPTDTSRSPRPAPAPAAAPSPAVRPPVLAAETLAALPEPLVEAAHRPSDAAALVLALAHEEPDRAASDDAPEWSSEARELPRALLLPMVEIALPALRELPPPERAALLRSVAAAVRADGRVSAWEHAVLAALRYGLGAPPRPRLLSDAALGQALSVLLAHLAHADGQADARAIARGRAVLQRAGLPCPDGPLPSPDAAAFDGALDQLASARPHQQKLALALADAAVHADGRVTNAESDLTGALAFALGQPLPGWALRQVGAHPGRHAVG